MMAVDANEVQNDAVTSQGWPYIDDELGDEIFSAGDIQWDSLLSSFVGFG
jgi:hypothetical protein